MERVISGIRIRFEIYSNSHVQPTNWSGKGQPTKFKKHKPTEYTVLVHYPYEGAELKLFKTLDEAKQFCEEYKMKDKVKALNKQIGGDHYSKLKIQPVEYIWANDIPFLEGLVIKYVTRHKDKNKLVDIKKAMHCLELIKEIEYGVTKND